MRYSGICLITESVPALVSFYEKVFGCQGEGNERHAELCFAGVDMAIFSKNGMEEMAKGSMQGAGYGSFTLMFEVGDVDEEYDRLQGLGVEFVKPPQTHPWGSRSVWFRDPDGNIIDFWCKAKL